MMCTAPTIISRQGLLRRGVARLHRPLAPVRRAKNGDPRKRGKRRRRKTNPKKANPKNQLPRTSRNEEKIRKNRRQQCNNDLTFVDIK